MKHGKFADPLWSGSMSSCDLRNLTRCPLRPSMHGRHHTWMVQERSIMSSPSVPRVGMYARMMSYRFLGMMGTSSVAVVGSKPSAMKRTPTSSPNSLTYKHTAAGFGSDANMLCAPCLLSTGGTKTLLAGRSKQVAC